MRHCDLLHDPQAQAAPLGPIMELRAPDGQNALSADSASQTVAYWQEPYRKGEIYYLRDGRVRGVLLWNVWDQVDAARRLIAEPGPIRPSDLQGRLPQKTSDQ